jgi:hypothetical protein
LPGRSRDIPATPGQFKSETERLRARMMAESGIGAEGEAKPFDGLVSKVRFVL